MTDPYRNDPDLSRPAHRFEIAKILKTLRNKDGRKVTAMRWANHKKNLRAGFILADWGQS